MQALVLSHGLALRADVPLPKPAADEALIRLKLAGICATDLELIKGYKQFNGILGHEFVGSVAAVGSARHRHWLNQRVVGSINIGCGDCELCRQQGAEHCLNRKVLGIHAYNGVFADYFTLPVANLYKVPAAVDDSAAVFAEPLAAALKVLEQLPAPAGQPIAVLGPGKLGLLIAKTLSLAGHQVIVIGRSARSLLLPAQWQLPTALITELCDNRFQYVVDASGQAEGFRQALRIIRPRGTLLLKSTVSTLEPVDLNKIVVGELSLLGSRCGSLSNALRVLETQSVPVETLIDGLYPLADAEMALQAAAGAGVRKILLHP